MSDEGNKLKRTKSKKCPADKQDRENTALAGEDSRDDRKKKLSRTKKKLPPPPPGNENIVKEDDDDYTVKKIPLPPKYEKRVISKVPEPPVTGTPKSAASDRLTLPPDGKRFRLAEKLLRIRKHFGLSQSHLNNALSTVPRPTNRARISQFENGARVPSLDEVLRYARLANVTMDVLVDDELDLPAEFPTYQECLTSAKRS